MVAPIIGSGSGITSRVHVGATESKSVTHTAAETRTGEQAQIRTPADAINILRTRLEQRVQQAMGGESQSSTVSDKYAAQAQPPTAADVANRILGFVQNRLQQEADAGADIERLSDLFSQAREGIEKGYAEAREQIQALGMMNETLAGEIDEGFNLIQDGLLNLEKLFLDKEAE